MTINVLYQEQSLLNMRIKKHGPIGQSVDIAADTGNVGGMRNMIIWARSLPFHIRLARRESASLMPERHNR